MNQQQVNTDYQERQRLLRLNACDIWQAVGVTFAEFQAQRVRNGLFKCPKCGTYYDPTYNRNCPGCGA